MTARRPPQSLAYAGRRLWDAVVIGAGPAGALASNLLSRGGASVLLVDAKSFPRQKVCGGCLNPLAVDILNRCGLESVLQQAAAIPLETVRFVTARQHLECELRGNLAIQRARFDEALVEASLHSGTEFLPGVQAQVLPEHGGGARRVLLRRDSETIEVAAHVVVCADGLMQSSLRLLPEFQIAVVPDSLIGLGAVLADEPAGFPAGQLTMAVARSGYVGLTRPGDGRLTIAAAVDAGALAGGLSPSEVIRRVLTTCGIPASASLDTVRWHGTPPLTRKSSRVAAERLVVIGDATGYVEPFTGEGIAWSLLSAALVTPLILRALSGPGDALATDWIRLHQQKVVRKQWMCRLLTRILRSSALTDGTLALCRTLPFLRRTIMSRLNSVPPQAVRRPAPLWS